MTNHVHLLVTPHVKESISRMMQYVGRKYVPYINHQYNRTGTLWEGRYKSSLIQEEPYLLACMRYIELNPVRANMVKTTSDYQWSRCQAYRRLFMVHMADNITGEIRAAWQTGTPLMKAMSPLSVEFSKV